MLAWNTGIQLLGKVLSTILGVFIIGLLTRYLGQEGFGVYTAANAYLQIFALILDLGINVTFIALLGEHAGDKTYERRCTSHFSLADHMAIVVLGIAHFFSWDLSAGQTSFAIVALTGSVFFQASIKSSLASSNISSKCIGPPFPKLQVESFSCRVARRPIIRMGPPLPHLVCFSAVSFHLLQSVPHAFVRISNSGILPSGNRRSSARGRSAFHCIQSSTSSRQLYSSRSTVGRSRSVRRRPPCSRNLVRSHSCTQASFADSSIAG